MNKKTCKRFAVRIFLALALVFAMAACQDPFSATHGSEGSLTINAVQAVDKSILPDSMAIATYRLSAVGPSAEELGPIDQSSGTFTFNGLALGDWTFSVQALDSQNHLVASGSTTVTLTSSSTANASIQLHPESGTGTFALNITWPADRTLDAVTATVKPADGSGSEQVLDCTITSNSASFTGSLSAGFWSLSIEFISAGKTAAVSRQDTVLIYNGNTSTGTLALSTYDFALPSEGERPAMVEIAGGTFNNGTANVTLGTYSISTTEITQQMFSVVLGYNPSSFTGNDLYPVERVTWYDAVEYCNKLSAVLGLESVYTITDRSPSSGYPISSATVTMDMSKNGYRLPTEAEWEFAARGGNQSQGYTYAGSNSIDDVAWYSSNSSGCTHEVAQKTANELGLYDMSGNVVEWCWDWYSDYSSRNQTDPEGPDTGTDKQERGGCYCWGTGYCQVTGRDYALPSSRGSNLGFRVARSNTVIDPRLSSNSGVYSTPQLVSMSTPTEGATIYYTTDGNDPSPSSGTAYTSPLRISTSTTLKAMAYLEGRGSSSVVTAVYDIKVMRPVACGTFNNGTANVTLGAYFMGTTEVTQGDWMAVMDYNPSSFKGDNDRPVENLTWYDAVEYCNKLSAVLGLESVYTITDRSPSSGYPITSATVTMDMSKNGYRLPTEAEWEFAARGGNQSQGYTYAGSSTIDDVAWYSSNSSGCTHEVAQKTANELGLYDMSGNVVEWCWDWYGDYSSRNQTDPQGPDTGSSKLERGGCYGWNSECQVAYRYYGSASSRGGHLGFRVARSNTVIDPRLSSNSGVYSTPQLVSMSTPTEGATIYYTTDGNDPSPSSGTAYTSPLRISTSTTLKAMAYLEGRGSSSVVTAVYDIKVMRPVACGTFNNGTANVTLGAYFMGTTEVTQGDWMAVMDYNPSSFKGDNDRPVEQVTWYDAVEYCNKLSTVLGLESVYTITDRSPSSGYPITSATVTMDMSKNGYRLPTEAEWEFAARGGNQSQGYTYAGSNTIDDVAWYSSNSSGCTHEVAQKTANELGLYDMSGNVVEWCWDWYGDYSSRNQTDPEGPDTGSSKLERGGCYGWNSECQVAYRYYGSASSRGGHLGFRVARAYSSASSVTIIPAPEQAVFTVSISGTQSVLSKGSDLSLSASSSLDGTTFTWYLDTQVIGTEASMVFGSSLTAGKSFCVTLIGTAQGRSASTRFWFTVQN